MAEMGYTKKTGSKFNKERLKQSIIKGVVFGDALICLANAIKTLGLDFEEVATVGRGMMGDEEVPFIHHVTEDGIDIPYGAYKISGLGRIIPTSSRDVVPELTVSIAFERNADETLWTKLLELVQEATKTHVSMFKGRAIKIVHPQDMIVPTYINVAKDIPLFLNDDVFEEVDSNIFFPILQAEQLNELGIGGQRGILLHGKYGTGKSLVAYMAAQLSVEAKRTFVLCTSNMLRHAFTIARFLEPSTLFVEDFDAYEAGSQGLSGLRNTMSGVEGKKGYDVITVLTTNFLERIEKTDRSLLRPDRIDAIVAVPSPNFDTTKKIVKHYAGKWLEERDWDSLYNQMAAKECTPAILVEIVKRSKISAVRDGGVITYPIMEHHFHRMNRQIELASPAPPMEVSPATRLADAMVDIAYYGRTNAEGDE